MATPIVRFNAVIDAYTDPIVLSNAKRMEISEAYMAQATDENILAAVPLAPRLPNGKVDRAAMTNTQVAEVVLARWLYDAKVVRRAFKVAEADSQNTANTTAKLAEADATFTN